ncbi:LOW QUALITY PROTEIN: putative glycosyltransferase 6 domain-containing protein 1 [Saccopteryx leptura]|uniref:LOW QUALITY PROTEIN: putative glycosyltransferase 6 domain-containing protein 1 n=1 Tax=Saccopteryx leptura TaxID=249018 RepID=UPI00339CDFEF
MGPPLPLADVQPATGSLWDRLTEPPTGSEAPKGNEKASQRKLLLWLLVLSTLLRVGCHRRNQEELQLSDGLNPRKRPDLVTTTDWQAPVIWEGTFDRAVPRRRHRRQNLTVGLAVFATGGTADLELFLKLANKHFMTGYRVVTYIMVPDWYQLPPLEPGPLRTFKVLIVRRDTWWPDHHLSRMKNLGEFVVSCTQGEVDFLFSMSMDQVFPSEVGAEAGGTAVAQLHARWYFQDHRNFPYEQSPGSAAFIPFGEGDFFYDGTFLGGTPQQVLNLAKAYLRGVIHDMRHGLNSTHERHLNKYFFLHKPTKLLSPEYNWDAALHPPLQSGTFKVLQLTRRGLWPSAPHTGLH